MTAPFLTVVDLRLIEQQLNKILKAKLTSNDQKIVATVRELAITELRERLTHVDEDIIKEVETIEDTIGAELFFQSLKSYTIPFKSISEQGLQKLFKKDKKLKLPKLETIDWQAISYLSWLDKGTNRQYIVLEKEGEYTALRGVVDAHNPIKGVCSICNQHSVVHLFTATVKGNGDNYTSYSNYICNDSQLCNQRVSDYDKLQEFVARNLI
ncbi:Fibronectin-binding protein (FBP) [Solibacillus isronensis B3W22]|uniref:Fibronectin-binding protein (FBP) n=1 Tax=Solibacillus isronensis B3W22 TaxID=1224748 RepID=K1KMN0_9BACL|nr:elongation factor G-binding protein [Solibacillus isronensis]AMO87266.1 elongation factor G-binding protein [Solibacillus silvestris]EKB45360.1 Fibronectin-binding protein (FBP) [Solibacillus isronensis B3W22]